MVATGEASHRWPEHQQKFRTNRDQQEKKKCKYSSGNYMGADLINY